MVNSWRKLSSLGLLGTICCAFSRLKLHVLRLYFGFDRWHADAPCCCRPYKQTVVAQLMKLPISGVVEIGCGLGDIGHLMRASPVLYSGLDHEHAVIEAGRFIHPSLSLQVGSFEMLPVFDERFDTLLLLNWPHGLSPIQLVTWLSGAPTSFKYIVMDLIKTEAPDLGFKFRHRVDELVQLGLDVSIVKTVEYLDHVRDLVIFKNGRSIHSSV